MSIKFDIWYKGLSLNYFSLVVLSNFIPILAILKLLVLMLMLSFDTICLTETGVVLPEKGEGKVSRLGPRVLCTWRL